MQFAIAIQKLEEAHRIDPANQLIISNLGGTYANVAAMASMMHKPQDCENYFKKAIAILEKCKDKTTLVPVLSNYSIILKSTGRVDEGKKSMLVSAPLMQASKIFGAVQNDCKNSDKTRQKLCTCYTASAYAATGYKTRHRA